MVTHMTNTVYEICRKWREKFVKVSALALIPHLSNKLPLLTKKKGGGLKSLIAHPDLVNTNSPGPCRASIFLVKEKMNPTLTHSNP